MGLIEKSHEGWKTRLIACAAAIVLLVLLTGFMIRMAEEGWPAVCASLAWMALSAALGWRRWRLLVDVAILNLPLWLILPMRLHVPNFSIVELALLSAALAGAVRVVREGRFRWVRTPLTPFMFLFGLAGMLSCALYFIKWFKVLDPVFFGALLEWHVSVVHIGQESEFHPLRSALTLIEGMVFFHVVVARVRDADDVRRLVRISLLSALMVSLFGISQFFTGWNKIETFEPWGHRINSTFPDVNSLASFLVANLFLLFGLLRREAGRRPHPVAWITLLAMLLSLYMAHSRMAYAALILTFPLFLLLSNRRIAFERPVVRLYKKQRLLAIVLVLLMILLGFACMGLDWSDHNDLAWTRTTGPVAKALKGRLNIWRSGLYNAAESPWFGIGIGSFYNFLAWNWEPHVAPGEWNWNPAAENAHSQLIQVLSDMGVVGLGLFLLILGMILYQGLRATVVHEDQRPLFAGIACAVVAFLLTCLTGHPMVLVDLNLWFWFAAAMLFAPAASESAEFARQQAGRKGLRAFALAALLLAAGEKSVEALHHGRPAFVGYGYYPYEHFEPYGKRYEFMWLKKHAVFRLQQRLPDLFFNLRNILGAAQPVNVTIRVNGRQIDRVHLADTKWHPVRYRLPETTGTAIRLEIVSDHEWQPEGDRRKVAVQVQSLRANEWY